MKKGGRSPFFHDAPRPLRLVLAAFGDPGHAFPMLALGRALVARGHDVTLQTWARWREHVEAEGIRFDAAPEYRVFPTEGEPLKPYAAAVRAARETRPLYAGDRADVAVVDILTPAASLAAQAEGVPLATLVPHVFPVGDGGFPPYSLGARLPRTALGRRLWRALEAPLSGGLEQGREQLNGARARLGLAPLDCFHGGISRELCLVGTLPQLEYPRTWPEWARVVGPLQWEPPSEEVDLPPGDAPLVLVAPSTSQDPGHRLLRASLSGLADAPVRVLATTNRRPLRSDVAVPRNARVVDWVSYSRTMPRCDLVVCHGGHGTLVRALTSGCPVVVSPAAGDMGENAARIDWAGLGVRLPGRLLSGPTLRLAVERALADPRMHDRVRAVAQWARHNDGAARAADAVEAFALRRAGDPTAR